ncbi:hypothetical protein K469DRAFT_705573 [Zopfia rhizophila CBS 207.26]|uniref:Ubiquitin-conjugating enzyme E2-binding protein n=1 Tax=Zopfia rhizophila CBS 207.26 TaxID=1314779 RepID=A0A6A6E774_9PEZI|nr:hypothetical protein K469DRAFT_705573 [Zopfia rhizophila CBS 207.26]
MPDQTLPASAFEGLELPSDTVKILTASKPPTPASVASPNLLQPGSESTPSNALSMNESSITLYAELLLHIRTVTLFASLRTVHSRETKAELSADGSSITVSHEGESATIRLPIKVKGGGGGAALFLPAQPPSKELTVRLQVEEEEGTDLLGSAQVEARKVNLVPWDGAALSKMQNVKILCRNCKGELVHGGKVGEWRDLPNENWAEMMDFWHCHKPDEHHLHDHTHEEVVGRKGYAAGNRLKAVAGVGFVDLTTLLVAELDCEGVKTHHPESSITPLLCKSCNQAVGTVDKNTEGWRIWKWSSSIGSSNSPSTTSTFNIQKWISARLLYLIENQGVRKFSVHPDSETSEPVSSLLLWVFTPDLLFSSSIPSTPEAGPTRAMKIFWQPQTFDPTSNGVQESTSVEEVAFPEEVSSELKRVLEGSQKLLPGNARKFQGWNVGLLERFDVGDIGMSLVKHER